MTHIAFQDRGDVELEVDVVIVGSGPGGATMARQLALGGLQVALVEAGAWRDPEDFPSTAYAGLRDVMPDFGSTIAQGRAFWPVVQGRGVGGGTLVNSAIAVRTPRDVLEAWRRDHGIAIPNLEERFDAHMDAVEADLCAEDSPASSLGRFNELALQGSRAAGYPSHVTKRFVKGCLGSGMCLTGCRNVKKQSLNLNYIPEMIRHGGVVLSCAQVDRVQIEGGRAVGVQGRFVHPQLRVKGAAFRVRARKAVVVAASVIQTPLILMRSGVRHPALGAGFRSHPGCGIFGLYESEVDMNRGATQGWASTHYRDNPGLKLESLSIPPEMAVSRFTGAGRRLMDRFAKYRHAAMWVCAVRADTVGSIRRGWFGGADVRYDISQADLARMREGVYLVAKTHFAAGAREVMTGIYGMKSVIGPDELESIRETPLDPRLYVSILSHLFGGAVMGADPQRAVCDDQGRVRGVEALVVGDASQIPTHLGVNPQLTIMALARIRAEQLLQALGSA